MEYTNGGLKITTEKSFMVDDIKETIIEYGENFKKVEDKVDLIVTNGGSGSSNSNAEVTAARIDMVTGQKYTTLSQRLDNQNRVHKEQITRLDNEKADKAYTNQQLQTKADQSFVDAQFASIVSGSPKGTFTDYAALVAKYPNGTEGTMLVLADGCWYWWDSTSNKWQNGGIYQAAGGEWMEAMTEENKEWIV